METETPQSLYVEKLKDLYSAVTASRRRAAENGENRLDAAAPRGADGSSSPDAGPSASPRPDLPATGQSAAKGRNCTAMETMIAETRHLMGDRLKATEMDAALIAAVQRFEQYEAAEYASLHSVRRTTGAQQRGHLASGKPDDEQAATEKKLAAVGGTRRHELASPRSTASTSRGQSAEAAFETSALADRVEHEQSPPRTIAGRSSSQRNDTFPPAL